MRFDYKALMDLYTMTSRQLKMAALFVLNFERIQRRAETIEALLKIFSLYLQIFWLTVHYRGRDLNVCSDIVIQHVLNSSARDLRFST